jgi:hypothetical protein
MKAHADAKTDPMWLGALSGTPPKGDTQGTKAIPLARAAKGVPRSGGRERHGKR